MKKHVCIDIYDTEGIVHETVEGDFDGEELLKEMTRAVSEDGIPVVRREQMSLEALMEPGKRPMTIAWRVGNVSFHADGAADDVRAQELTFRAILPDLLKQIKYGKPDNQ